MKKKQWYKSLFENYSETYDRKRFMRGTSGESDFLKNEINRDKTLKIIDAGDCRKQC